MCIRDSMASPRLIGRIKTVMAKVQANYPETSHTIHVVHPPSSFKALFALVSTFLNQRQLDKIEVHRPPADLIPVLAEFMSPAAILSWVSAREEGSGDMHLNRGQTKYLAIAVQQGERLRLNGRPLAGGHIPCELALLSEQGYQKLWSGKIGKVEQQFDVPPGVAVLTLDNYLSLIHISEPTRPY
eukprot:TRINITY_DN18359_c0_g1_i1.p1 TRINITY_DN18359_c0_g1~~TRINITY_DN18359_c0_g1_i1.p1  ORF type:complete len:185 (-),score=47.44 TRINITY_DN18359_c0_g1_i1:48-602(-)